MKKIKLTQGKFALVDDEDFEWLNRWKWHLNGQGYACRTVYVIGSGRKNQKCNRIRMHRLINNTPESFQTDHINRNRIDNRKINLRTVTDQENKFNLSLKINNTSGYRGVTWDKQTNKWMAQIAASGKNHKLGRFINIKDAIIARKKGEEKYHAI
jgi:hypothetical protein